MMKKASKMDEDCDGLIEDNSTEEADKTDTDAQAFKRKYKEFYTDIKISHREDW